MVGQGEWRMSLRRIYAITVVVLVGFLFVGALVASTAYTRHVQRESDQRWCDLLQSLDQPQTPPSTERGARIQQQIHDLRRELRCG